MTRTTKEQFIDFAGDEPGERKPLTNKQIDEACKEIFGSDYGGCLTLALQRAIARAIEAAHGIKDRT